MSISNGEAMGQSRESDANPLRKSSNVTDSDAVVFFPSDSDNETEMDNLKKNDENLSEYIKVFKIEAKECISYFRLKIICLIRNT
jgi:hypothetical protein